MRPVDGQTPPAVFELLSVKLPLRFIVLDLKCADSALIRFLLHSVIDMNIAVCKSGIRQKKLWTFSDFTPSIA